MITAPPWLLSRVGRFDRTVPAAAAWTLLVVAMVASVLCFLVQHLAVEPVLSGSMRGTFDPGSAVLTRSIPVQDLRVGDVLEFYPPNETTAYTHRVVSLTGDPAHPVVTTRGDANPTVDPWHARLTGPSVRVVVGSVPHLGRALVWLDRSYARTVLVGLLGLLATAFGTAAILRRPPDTRPA